MSFRVNAVIVTCNRCDLLKKSISGLLSSNYKINNIIIVNNASTDDTKEYLDSLENENLICIHKDKNEGGAGGFFYGMQAAYELGCDFLWIMDDDTVVTPEALDELINSYNKISYRNIGFLASNVFWSDNKPCYMNICNTCYDWNEFAADGIIKISHCSFVSMLIPSWVVKDVGYPIKEYFIWGDDGEYSTRILQKYEGYLCGRSIVHHLMTDNVGVDIFNVEKNRIDRFFYFYRNWMCTNLCRSKEDAVKFEKESKKLAIKLLKSNSSYKYKKAWVILKGLHAGKKFDVTISYPDKSSETANKTITGQSGAKRIAYNIFRYFGIKYDIRTNGNTMYCHDLYNRFIRIKPTKSQIKSLIINGYRKTHRYNSGDKCNDLHELLKNVDIKVCSSKYFAYSIDIYKTWKINKRQMGNCTPDYELLVNQGLNSLYIDGSDAFSIDNNRVIDAIKIYIERLSDKVIHSKIENRKNVVKWLERMDSCKADSLEEALQRILLVNQLLWQTRHIQIGLGRLDYILEDYLSDEYTDEQIVDVLNDFLKILHNYYWLKSEEMLGDTGQIIILGGLSKDGGRCVNNRLTYCFLKSIKQLQLPDPKVLLRINDDTPDDLIELACECISTGIGSPVLSNDNKVLSYLYNYGYEYEDANNYVTSACWEIIPGNCCEQNNLTVFNFAETFELFAKKEDLDALDTWEKFIGRFADNLCGHIWYMANMIKDLEWEKDPLLSAFSTSCRASKRDISDGGCKYNNYGILSLALSNTVNSLINLRRLVYIEKKYSLKEIFIQRNMNFVDDELRGNLQHSPKFFGSDSYAEEDVIGLTNWLIGLANEVLNPFVNKLGGGIKFGLSSPGYVVVGSNSGATFDGRLCNQPYSIHISNDYLPTPTSLINFVGSLQYGHSGFNGNVVDLTFSTGFIRDNLSKFIDFIKSSISIGIFEMQINVLDYKLLLKARSSPEEFPNLIVRVWGFSAYFKDIPDEYKDYLIERARLDEVAC